MATGFHGIFGTKTYLLAGGRRRQHDSADDPAGLATICVRFIVRMICMRSVDCADDRHRPIRKHIVHVGNRGLRRTAGRKRRGLMAETEQQQSDGANHAHQPPSHHRFC